MSDETPIIRDEPIQPGERIPAVQLRHLVDGTMRDIDTAALLQDGRTVLFGVPGAFTPTCSGRHLPGFLALAGALKEKGIARIVCLSVNDPFVMRAWGEDQNVGDSIVLLPDGNADFTRALGLAKDARGFGLGMRCLRFAMVTDGDGVVQSLAVDESGLDATSAERVLASL